MRGRGFVLADEDVSAPGPMVETGATVPGYSRGVAACAVFSYPNLEGCDQGPNGCTALVSLSLKCGGSVAVA